MSEDSATRLIVSETAQNRISARCAEVSDQEISSYEPAMPPQDGEAVIGALDDNLIKWYVCTELEYDRLQDDLYKMTEDDEGRLDKIAMEIAGILKARFLFVMAVRGFFGKEFPEKESRPFQVRKGWIVVAPDEPKNSAGSLTETNSHCHCDARNKPSALVGSEQAPAESLSTIKERIDGHLKRILFFQIMLFVGVLIILWGYAGIAFIGPL